MAGGRPDLGPVSPGPGDPAWDALPWMAPYRVVPEDATWPRLMTGPHPRAVGSLGDDLIAWSAARGVELRYWQRLAAARILEVDREGSLVWPAWILTTARQVGKSWGLRELLLWRIHQGARWGEPQTVVHTGKDLPVCREVQRPARSWAHRQAGYTVREANGMEEIETPDGSRWIIRGKGSIYGYSASLGAVDEAWKVAPDVVEDGLEPTMAERASAQLALLSTAHRMATGLVPARRLAALAQLDRPGDVLLLEWSAPPDADLADRDAWRQASPYWSARRERLIGSQFDRAQLAGVSDDPDEPDPVEAFRSQWLNIWPERGEGAMAGRIEPLLEEGAWARLGDLAATTAGPLVIAVEDNFGRGACALAGGRLADGRPYLWGAAFPTRAGAWAWAELTAAIHPGSLLVTGPGLDQDPAGAAVMASSRQAMTSTTTRVGLAAIRDHVATGRVAHDGGQDLALQLAAYRVVPSPTGGLSPSGQARGDLVRAAAWVLAVLGRPAEAPPARFVVR